jgi:hypothetical protein
MVSDMSDDIKKDIEEILQESKRPKSTAEMMPGIIMWLVMGVLIILKSIGMITLSWWWITILLWLPFAFAFGIFGFGLVMLVFGSIIFGVISIVESIKKRIKTK